MKRCSRCKEEKSLEEFHKHNQTKNGVTSECKDCAKVYRETHKEKLKLKSQKYYKKNKEKIDAKNKLYREKQKPNNPVKYLLWNIKHRAKKKGIIFDLVEDDIVIPEICPIFKKPFVFGTGKQELNSPSIDRIDNTRGYEKDNIVVVSFRANRLKNNASIKELILLADFYKQFKES